MTDQLRRITTALFAAAAPVAAALGQCSPQTIGTLPEPAAWSFALDGDTAVGGYPIDNQQTGIAYTYHRDAGGVWTLEQAIKGHDIGWLDDFGSSVAVSGGIVLVGADHWDAGGGAVYSFERDQGGAWTERFRMDPPPVDDCYDEDFGSYIVLSGHRALVSAYESCDGGAAYVMTRADDGTWFVDGRLHASDARPTDSFGTSLSIHGDLAAVGMADWYELTAGRAFAFARSQDGTWSQEAILVPPATPGLECWRTDVSVSADGLLVRAYYAASEDDAYHQRIFVYGRDVHGQWTLEDELIPDGFGVDTPYSTSIALYDHMAIVGTRYDDRFGLNVGAVHVFRPDGQGRWPESAAFIPEDFDGGASFGAVIPASGYQAGIFGVSPPPAGVMTMYDMDLTPCAPDCPPDLNLDGRLDLFDFLEFVNLFNGGVPAADCDHSGSLDLFDFLCFTNSFNAGC